MASHFPKADAEILKPGVILGRHPDTGVLHKLTINTKDQVIIERKPYVSDHADGWTKTYETITDEASKHTFLILKIRQNAVDWSQW